MSECLGEYLVKHNRLVSKKEFSDTDINEGISLYEVIRVIEGTPIFLKRHLNRLLSSAEIVNQHIWMEIQEIKKYIQLIIEKNNIREGNIKLVFNIKELQRTFYAYFIESHYPSAEQYENGVCTVLCFMERSNPKAKVINKGLREATNKLIAESGAYEAILIDRCGNITEGSRSNIFMIKGQKVITAPLNNVLSGITRQLVVEICSELGITVEETEISFREIETMDAFFISGTSPKILPINKINDFILPSSTNIIVQNIMRHYNRSIMEDIIQNREN